MGIFSEINEFGRRIRESRQLVRKRGNLFRRLEKIVENKETNEIIRQSIIHQFRKAQRLVSLEAADKMGGEVSLFSSEMRTYLLNQLNARDVEEGVLNTVEWVNNHYNSCVSDEGKWVAAEIKFLRYSYENRKLLTELIVEENVAQYYGLTTAAEIDEHCQQLVAEEQRLQAAVERLEPDHKLNKKGLISPEEWFRVQEDIEKCLSGLKVSIKRLEKDKAVEGETELQQRKRDLAYFTQFTPVCPPERVTMGDVKGNVEKIAERDVLR